MRRNVRLEDISDGKLYTAQDMVRADCRGCQGCSACCQGMGSSILLDPRDIWLLTKGTGKDFEGLLAEHAELVLSDGIVLPCLRMAGKEETCTFLDREGRCSIHPFRPGICRMFPLGRYYEETGFRYFLQLHECPKTDRTKIRVRSWLDIPDLKRYEAYIFDWHTFLKVCERESEGLDGDSLKILQMYLLRTFYQTPWDGEDFYGEFYSRLWQVKEKLGL